MQTDSSRPPQGTGGPRRSPGKGVTLVLVIIAAAIVAVALAGVWKWFFSRIEVEPNEIAVLIAKMGEDLPSGQIIATEEGQKGIQLEVLSEGRHFRNPVKWGWQIKKFTIIPAGQFAVKIRRYGKNPTLERLQEGWITAQDGEKGIVGEIVREGKHAINPYAYEVEMYRALVVPAGFVGVVTNLEGSPPRTRNEFLVGKGEKGVQKKVLTPEKYYLNPYVKKVDMVDTRSQRFELTGEGALRFPSSDGFTITVRMIVEWAVDPDRAPEVLVRIGDLDEVLQKILIPMLRGFGRVEGSKNPARDYISGETRLTFQNAVLKKIRSKAADSGILIKSLLVNEIEPPQAIAQPIREREIAKEELARNKQQLTQAQADQKLARQEALVMQEQKKVEAETEKLQIEIAARNRQEVALIKQEQLLQVAKTDFDAAKREAKAIVSRGQAAADVVRFQREAEAEALRLSIVAFPNGAAFARYEFYKKVAPRILSVFADTEGAFGDIFEEYLQSGRSKP
ncbi:MAG: SPFH domain-containing protein [Planctomycetota bacterium]|nr:SPFH domain-containing protein [Planctomycetota bacterium]